MSPLAALGELPPSPRCTAPWAGTFVRPPAGRAGRGPGPAMPGPIRATSTPRWSSTTAATRAAWPRRGAGQPSRRHHPVAVFDLRVAPVATRPRGGGAARRDLHRRLHRLPGGAARDPTLSSLSEDAFRRVSTLLVRRLPDGEPVIREGEPGQSFFFVAGTVRPSPTGSVADRWPASTKRCSARWRFVGPARKARRSRSSGGRLLEVTRESLSALASELDAVAEALHASPASAC